MFLFIRSYIVFLWKNGEYSHIHVCMQRLQLESHSYEKLQKKPLLTLVWASSTSHPQTVTQTITLFTPVVCRLVATSEPMKWIVCTVMFIRQQENLKVCFKHLIKSFNVLFFHLLAGNSCISVTVR